MIIPSFLNVIASIGVGNAIELKMLAFESQEYSDTSGDLSLCFLVPKTLCPDLQSLQVLDRIKKNWGGKRYVIIDLALTSQAAQSLVHRSGALLFNGCLRGFTNMKNRCITGHQQHLKQLLDDTILDQPNLKELTIYREETTWNRMPGDDLKLQYQCFTPDYALAAVAKVKERGLIRRSSTFLGKRKRKLSSSSTEQ